jgi:hypothetical protein
LKKTTISVEELEKLNTLNRSLVNKPEEFFKNDNEAMSRLEDFKNIYKSKVEGSLKE